MSGVDAGAGTSGAAGGAVEALAVDQARDDEDREHGGDPGETAEGQRLTDERDGDRQDNGN